jgi:hypothetical protein
MAKKKEVPTVKSEDEVTYAMFLKYHRDHAKTMNPDALKALEITLAAYKEKLGY